MADRLMPPSHPSQGASAEGRAAQYVRMSTEHQRYSIENQKETIGAYAAANGLEVVETYADPGKSGLTLQRRPGLRQLLRDVVEGQDRYSTLLIYDVSRWGRFQDVDESAHYEFLLRRSGLRVVYCAESFANDGSPYSSIIKNLRRVMAGEHSRDLSTRVSASRHRSAAQGHWLGAQLTLGLRRVAVSSEGVVRGVLAERQPKWSQSDHVILVPGPEDEQAYVRRVFELYVDGWRRQHIAEWLTEEGVRRPYGRHWNRDAIETMLTNEAYVGTIVTGKFTATLGAELVPRPRQDWHRIEGALEPVVDRELFEQAGAVLALRGRRRDEAEALDALRALWKREGKLSQQLIDADPATPSANLYFKRFGCLRAAYDLIGYSSGRSYAFLGRKAELAEARSQFRAEVVAGYRTAGATVDDLKRGRLLIDGKLNVALSFLTQLHEGQRRGGAFWYIQNRPTDRPDLRVVKRLDEQDRLLDYLILPRSALTFAHLCLTRQPRPPYDQYRHATLDALFGPPSG